MFLLVSSGLGWKHPSTPITGLHYPAARRRADVSEFEAHLLIKSAHKHQKVPWPSVISRRNARFPPPPPCPELAVNRLWSVWSPHPELVACPLWSVSSLGWGAFLHTLCGLRISFGRFQVRRRPPHLQSAMHPLWLVPGWVGRSSSTPERTCIYATNPKLPHIPCPQNTRPGTRRRGAMSSKGAAQAQGRQRAAEGPDSDYPPRK